jgi:hypothetical protein
MKTLHILLIVLIAYFILSKKESFGMPLDDICNLNQDGNECSTSEGLAKAVAYCKDKYSKQMKANPSCFSEDKDIRSMGCGFNCAGEDVVLIKKKNTCADKAEETVKNDITYCKNDDGLWIVKPKKPTTPIQYIRLSEL